MSERMVNTPGLDIATEAFGDPAHADEGPACSGNDDCSHTVDAGFHSSAVACLAM